MLTAVDSSVLFDVLSADRQFLESSERALRAAARHGALILCPVVWSEIRAHFGSRAQMEREMAAAGIGFDPLDQARADLAGELWSVYRRAGGPRERLIGDFLIGAHAQLRCGRLLSRDRGFYRRYFTQLEVLH
ncbi:MAG TPA: type II toxin-antitoxin system VapC family toxin [Terriglobales bacterium]|nr:type II toxin-antitoxin system VapC family toxin [Terriglobales bacterium]